MNELVTSSAAPSSLALRDDELLPVLQSSLYPGAKPESIKLVLGYCRAAGLDPMQKPVHIVPMWDKEAKSMRDVIMPGVGLYRTQAARSGAYFGVSEPTFGPDRTENIGGVEITYPEFCRVTVKRQMPGGFVAEFTAIEYWLENYAVAGRDSTAPNAMWRRRPRGQLAKCAEAQALRKAFPEVGAQPTADEVDPEGFVIDDSTGQPSTAPSAAAFNVQRKTKSEKAADVVDATPAADAKTVSAAPSTSTTTGEKAAGEKLVGAGEIAYLKRKAEAAGIDLSVILERMGGLVLEKLSKTDFDTIKAELMSME